MCVTGIERGRSSAVSTSVKAVKAEQTVASGAWNGGLMEEMIDGVKTSTFGGVCFSPTGCRRAVRRGRKAWIVTIGWRMWVLNTSAKLLGGMVAMGDVW